LITLADVFEALTGTRSPEAPLIISEASIDSRQMVSAGLFVALSGERVDGHRFVGAAFRHGARCALIEHDLEENYPVVDLRAGPLSQDIQLPEPPFCLRVENTLQALQKLARFWRRQLNVRVIGVTGSVGKSTTKELVSEVISQRYRTLKNIGNLNNEIGLPLSLLRLTPGYERAVLEMGFYVPGEIAFLCDLAQPSIGVVTNIGTVHSERAGSQAEIARGKTELVQALPVDGVAVLNYDDPWVRPMAAHTQAKVLFYGMNPAADLWADQIEGLGLEGIQMRMHYQGEVVTVSLPLIGRHSAMTALRAAAVGLADGLSWPEITAGLQQGHSQLRLTAVHTPNGALVLDDTYNAEPQSTLAALDLLADIKGRHVAVLGDMLELGQYEQAGHKRVGERAAHVCQELVAVGQLGKIIAETARQSGLQGDAVTWFGNVPEAIDYLKGHLNRGDVVLVKGSHGLRMDRIVSALENQS
jgi:UDP-N-acetylmuramoyl-tripeptide--D-alanyl-D-alanine ligase